MQHIFPDISQLPYYIDGDVKLTQSNAILRYVAGKHNLIGTNDKERIRVDLTENEVGDFRNGWVRLCYSPNFVSHSPYIIRLEEQAGVKILHFDKG